MRKTKTARIQYLSFSQKVRPSQKRTSAGVLHVAAAARAAADEVQGKAELLRRVLAPEVELPREDDEVADLARSGDRSPLVQNRDTE